MLREIADREFFRPCDSAGERLQLVGQQLDQRRLAVAVGAEQGDAVVGVDAQRDAIEHRLFRIVADRDVIDGDDRRRQHLLRRRERDFTHVLGHQRGDRLHPFQHFHAGLRLAGLGSLGLEAVDEGLQPLALVGLALGVLGVQHLARGALFLERGIAALVERQLAPIEMQDLVDRGVEQVAVMADHDHGAGIVGQMVFQPQRAFEIEIVGRLVQQQQVWRREQRRRQRHSHAPAAGEFRARPRLIRGGKSKAAQDCRRAGRRGVGIDIDQPHLNLGDPVRIISGFGFMEQRVALQIGFQHDIDEALRAVRRLLRQAADAPTWRQGDAAGLDRQIAADRVKQRRFADAVAADEADARARHDLHRAVVDQEPPGNADRNIRDGKHAALSPDPAPNATHLSANRLSLVLNATRCRGGAAHRRARASAAAVRCWDAGFAAAVRRWRHRSTRMSCDRSVRYRC